MSRATCDGVGWVYFNEDAGEEYAPNHPVKSGEVPDATRIRRSTAQEDVIWRAFQDAHDRAHALSASPAPSGQGVSGEPVAWSYDLATSIGGDGTYSRFDRRISFQEPSVPEGAIRNLTPLYAAPAPSCAPGEVERLMHVIDRNRYTAAACVNAVEFVLHTRRWLSEAGRGSYAYDDDRYQQEFGLAFDEIMEALRPMRAVAQDKTDCTTDPEKVQAARVAGADRFAALSPQGLDAATVERCAQVADLFVSQRRDPMKTDAGKIASRIRALATEPHQHGAGNGEKHGG